MPILPPGIQVLERGWLSSNNILLQSQAQCALVDSGYHRHSAQTVALVSAALDERALDLLVNTHLHSDHCGGNAALQQRYPQLQTWIPPGLADGVRQWDEEALSYRPTGQDCPRFAIQGLLQPGNTVALGDFLWQVHAAPGHDPDSVMLFEPSHRLLISADALWENGFGVVFPELDGASGFTEVGQTLDLIESLDALVVIPGHGRVFTGVAAALKAARRRLASFVVDPRKHGLHAAKVLLKFKLLEFQRVNLAAFTEWARQAALIEAVHQRDFSAQPFEAWTAALIDDLVRVGAARVEGDWLLDC